MPGQDSPSALHVTRESYPLTGRQGVHSSPHQALGGCSVCWLGPGLLLFAPVSGVTANRWVIPQAAAQSAQAAAQSAQADTQSAQAAAQSAQADPGSPSKCQGGLMPE